MPVHLIASAGWDKDERVRCRCGWSIGSADTDNALAEWIAHVETADAAERDVLRIDA